MTLPTLRVLIAEAEQLLESVASVRSYEQWRAECDALTTEMNTDTASAGRCYSLLLKLPAPDPATLPPAPTTYREITPAEAHTAMITGYRAGLDAQVDRQIDTWRTDGTLPESIAGLEALAKLIGAAA